MSKIESKSFDAQLKIDRSVFLGSPNLFTSADLNRQIEAIKYQLDLLDDKTGFVSDMDLSNATLDNAHNILSVTPNYRHIEHKGCDFHPAISNLQINMKGKSVAYLILRAKRVLINYEDDPTHNIAGATFIDGTSQPAASQYVYKDEHFELVDRVNSYADSLVIGILARFTRTQQGTLKIEKNFSGGMVDPITFRSNNVVTETTSYSGEIVPGISYDTALNILQNRLNKLKNSLQPTWASLKDTDKVRFKITDGVLYLRISETILRVRPTQQGHPIVVNLGDFPTSVNNKLLQYFTDLGIVEDYSSFGSFGTCYLVDGSTSGNSSPYKYEGTVMEIWNLCLNLNEHSSNVSVGARQLMEVDLANNKIRTIDSSASFGPMTDGTLIVPQMTVAIPLPGLNW